MGNAKETRRNFLRSFAGVAALSTALPAEGQGQTSAQPKTFSVHDFGAVGDGKADDTFAFQQAITAVSKFTSGRVVSVPAGQYRITSSLSLESTLLLGTIAGGWPADSVPLPTLLVDVPDPQPCVIANIGASLHGLCFNYLYRDNPGRIFGPCVLLKGGGVSLTNLLLHQPTEGIMWDGSTNIGRLNLENVFIVNARKCGVYVAHTLDIATLTNVEAWNYQTALLDTSTGFRLGANDEIRLSNCSVVAAAIGFHFVETKLPSGERETAWGGMVNCTVDACATGVKIDAARTLRIQGGTIQAHHFGIIVNGRSNVMLTGADVRANSAHCLQVKDCDTLTATGCLFKKNTTTQPKTAKVAIDGGENVLVSGCMFDERSIGISVGPGIKRFSITGNVFAKMEHKALLDESGKDAKKIIAQNLAG
jgi:polygalacturonase